MQKIIFTGEYCRPANLHPFTLTRQIQDIRIGILTIREKWEMILNLPSFSKWEDHYLDGPDSVKIDRHIGPEPSLLVHANVLPSKPIIAAIKKLKNGEFLSAGDDGGIAFAFSQKEVAGLHKIRVNRLVGYRDKPNLITYPWHIVQMNDWAIREDFALITNKRKTAPVPENNKLVNASQVFLEKGAKVSHSILNAEEGPIYIGKNALVMEGCLIRGPVAIGEGSVVKMGSRIYGATTIGPYSMAGGEIKNSVLFGYSNKAHDGYLGDSVLGEWCNLGAGTTVSNLKNNCSEVKYWVDADKKEINAGIKGGLLMGDHSRAAINTSFNTGTVVGVSCNVFAAGLTPKLIPNFSWGCDGITRYKLSKAVQDAAKWKKLKGRTLRAAEKKILAEIYKNY